MSTEERRSVVGFPGYSVTRDGRVYSTNNSRDGKPKEVRKGKGPNRKVCLTRGPQVRKERKISDLVMEAWGTLEHFNREDDVQ